MRTPSRVPLAGRLNLRSRYASEVRGARGGDAECHPSIAQTAGELTSRPALDSPTAWGDTADLLDRRVFNYRSFLDPRLTPEHPPGHRRKGTRVWRPPRRISTTVFPLGAAFLHGLYLTFFQRPLSPQPLRPRWTRPPQDADRRGERAREEAARRPSGLHIQPPARTMPAVRGKDQALLEELVGPLPLDEAPRPVPEAARRRRQGPQGQL